LRIASGAHLVAPNG
jgi:hypothetical protein